MIAVVLLISGLSSLATSIMYTSSILAFIGLSLTFWGALLFYIAPSKRVKLDLLNSTTLSSLQNIDLMITELDCKGKGIYLPPKYTKGMESEKVFLSAKDETTVPSLEEIKEERVFMKNPNGVCLTPPGLALTKLFEKELGTDFTKADIEYLRAKLPQLFIEDLEIAEDLQIETENTLINVEIKGSIYENLCKETRKFQKICNLIGCPLTSSLACALTKASGKPVIIQKEETNQENRTVKIQYRILEEEPT